MTAIKWVKRFILVVFLAILTGLSVSSSQARSLSGLADSAWPMFQHDPQHTGRSQFQGPVNKPVKLWETTVYAGDQFITGPYIILGKDGTIYTNPRDIYAIDPVNKTILWNYPYAGSFPPAISQDGTLYYGAGASFFALGPDGQPAWYIESLDGNYASSSSPAIDANGNVYLVHDALWSFFPFPQGDPLSPLRWVIPEWNLLVGSPAIGRDGTIYYGSHAGLVAMNPDKTVKWVYEGGSVSNQTPFVHQTPYIQYNPENPADGSILIYDSNNYCLYSFSLDGTYKWSYGSPSTEMGEISLASDGSIYLATQTGFKALNYDGTLKFSTKEGNGGKMIVDQQNNVLKCSKWDCMGYDKNGNLLWTIDRPLFPTWDLQGGFLSAPVIAADGLFYVAFGRDKCKWDDISCPSISKMIAYGDPTLVPVLSASEETVHLNIHPGQSIPPKVLNLTSTVHPVAWSASLKTEAGDWVKLSSVSSGTTPADISLDFHVETLPIGIYQATLSIRPIGEVSRWLDIPIVVEVKEVEKELSNKTYIPAISQLSKTPLKGPYFLSYKEQYVDGSSYISLGVDQSGKISRLALDHTYDGRVSWSPDGKKYASSNGQIYTMTPDGNDYFEVTRGGFYRNGSPTWSPDGLKICFTSKLITSTAINRYEDDELRVANIDGTGLKALTGPMNVMYCAWSPDSQKIAFTTIDEPKNYMTGYKAYVINVDGSNLRQLGNPADSMQAVAWSPDGSKILLQERYYGENGDIFTINPDGAGIKNISNSPTDDFDPAWSPDGKTIAFTRSTKGGMASWEIFVMNADGSQQEQITNNTQEGAGIPDEDPLWSPDGRYLAYRSYYHVAIMDFYTREILWSGHLYQIHEGLSWRPMKP